MVKESTRGSSSGAVAKQVRTPSRRSGGSVWSKSYSDIRNEHTSNIRPRLKLVGFAQFERERVRRVAAVDHGPRRRPDGARTSQEDRGQRWNQEATFQTWFLSICDVPSPLMDGIHDVGMHLCNYYQSPAYPTHNCGGCRAPGESHPRSRVSGYR